jgi:hypothetical protein
MEAIFPSGLTGLLLLVLRSTPARGVTLARCVEAAERQFMRQTVLSPDPRREEERKKLGGLNGALVDLRQYDAPGGIRLDGDLDR